MQHIDWFRECVDRVIAAKIAQGMLSLSVSSTMDRAIAQEELLAVIFNSPDRSPQRACSDFLTLVERYGWTNTIMKTG